MIKLNDLNVIAQRDIQQGYTPFFGCFMQQNPLALIAINRLLNGLDFDRIIELGTHDGGLSSLFALYAVGSRLWTVAENESEVTVNAKNQSHHKVPKVFYTIDNQVRDIGRNHLLTILGSYCLKADILNDPNTQKFIQDLLTKGGRNLLLCDNGDKIKEFYLFAPFLKEGDVIMIHDWAYDDKAAQELKEAKLWYSHEVDYNAIKDGLEQHNIQQIYQETFDSVAWFCGIKVRESQ